MEYIHYGHKHFEVNEFEPISNRELFPKPFGGFWASPVNAEYGWKDWNESEHFRECKLENSFKFRLNEKAKVLRIKSVNDLEELPKAQDGFGYMVILDFEKLTEQYDAIEVTIGYDRDLYYALYGWDCDSILIMNPDVVVECK